MTSECPHCHPEHDKGGAQDDIKELSSDTSLMQLPVSTSSQWTEGENDSVLEEQVLRKRPYIRCNWCEQALHESVRREVQPDGRVRLGIFTAECKAYLRVVTLVDYGNRKLQGVIS
jgi:hypothetical protein